MLPALALLGCVAFVVGLLWMEAHRSSGQSKALWVATLWVLYSASRPVSFWFGINTGGDAESGNPVERVILSAFIFVGLTVLVHRRFNWSQAVRENRWLVILFAYMFISILWSDYPFVSLKRWVKTGGTFVMALIALQEESPYVAMRAVFMRTLYIAIPFSVVLVKYFPAFGRSYAAWSGKTMWQGVTLTKNTLGVLCMVTVLLIVWALLRRWAGREFEAVKHETIADLAVLGMALWLLRGPGEGYSATSTVVLCIGLATLVLLLHWKPPARYLAPTAFLLLFGGGLLLLILHISEISPLTIVAGAVGRDETLTSRTGSDEAIWPVLFPIAMKHPILGVGYGGFWVKPVDGLDYKGVPINEAHNGYLDVFIELGAVGILLLVPLAVSFFMKARDEFEYRPDWASLRLACLPVMLIHNITETSWLSSTMLLWNLFIFLAVVYPEQGVHEFVAISKARRRLAHRNCLPQRKLAGEAVRA